jgi:hypothetical protein
MNVSIPPGTAAVPLQAGQGAAVCTWDAAEVVTLAAAPPSGQSRIDLVVAQVRDNAIDGGANNDFVFAAVAGTAAASNPAAPAVPTNAYVMCQVLVPGAAANLNTATITDRRAQLSYQSGIWTPTWTAAGGPPGIGNGSLVGKWTVIGNECFIHIMLTFGSTSNGSNGSYNFGAPFPAAPSTAGFPNEYELVAKLFTPATAANWLGTVGIAPGSTTLAPSFPVAAGNVQMQAMRNADGTNTVGTGIPAIPGSYTLTNGGNLIITGAYPIA